MSRETLPAPGLREARWHKHPCGCWCKCTYGDSFTSTTPCWKHRTELREVASYPTPQESANQALDAERAALYVAHESGGAGVEW